MSGSTIPPHDARPAEPGVGVSEHWEAVVVGGGPAGLSAALVLARCRRRVLVVDSGHYRNARADRLRAYLTRDGTRPDEFLALARAEVERYGVEVRRARVTSACRRGDGFELTLDPSDRVAATKLLLATGVVDRLPALDGIEAFWGTSVVHCPFCDGWELRNRPLGVYGHGRAGLELSLALQTWSPDVTLFTDGPARIDRLGRDQLARYGIHVCTARIARLAGRGAMLEAVVLREPGGERRVACGGLFLTTGQVQHSDLAPMLGCERTPRGAIRTDRLEQSTVPGVFVVGDASRDPQLAIIAAAEGAKAAFAVHHALPVHAPRARADVPHARTASLDRHGTAS